MRIRPLPALAALALLGPFFLTVPCAYADESEEREEAPVVEIGALSEWPTNGGAANAGGAVGFEATVIQDWLEIELGAAALGTSGHTEFSGDLIFKKPFHLSPTTDFMLGIGPMIRKTLSGPDQGIAHGAEVDFDFMFWPRKELGWYVQPAWSLIPRNGEQSVGINVGVLIRVR